MHDPPGLCLRSVLRDRLLQVAFDSPSHAWDIFCANCDLGVNSLPVLRADAGDGPGATSAPGGNPLMLRLRSRTDTSESGASESVEPQLTSDAATSPIAEDLLRLSVSTSLSPTSDRPALPSDPMVSPLGPPACGFDAATPTRGAQGGTLGHDSDLRSRKFTCTHTQLVWHLLSSTDTEPRCTALLGTVS